MLQYDRLHNRITCVNPSPNVIRLIYSGTLRWGWSLTRQLDWQTQHPHCAFTLCISFKWRIEMKC